jgi:cysteine-rich repeat protein
MLKPTSVLAAALAVVLSMSGCSGTEGSSGRSLSQVLTTSSADGGDAGCTFTQGYWKNHPDAWPVSSLTIGTVTYTKAELLVIFSTPVKGNGLIALAHQLIAAKLNVASGAASGSISASISDADNLIGGLVLGSGSLSTSATASLTASLDGFNNGESGPGHCGSTPPPPPPPPPPVPPICGNGVMEAGEHCDDGNTVTGDGCTATCECEEEIVVPPPPPPPVCGNGVMEGAEGCDDGNDIAGDGCSPTCICEPGTPPPPPPPPVCGNGVVETGEHCDDGNLVCGDGCSDVCAHE